ncbi:hypothetical protein HMPREF9103_01321 [Lentilactobacillus parafarraginis F0439]|uniref:Uncharacterized protein n=1 Tax=Lentilactobacillus parafarraginis F0439 TaxID=797515 RepID=G9ZNL8_9LACO|nr:hypothetical protein HMPREF9103_01321 [Lentilactobacillus parafarraginis F0439]
MWRTQWRFLSVSVKQPIEAINHHAPKYIDTWEDLQPYFE